MDHLTKEERSANMGKIRSKDTLPEMRVRKALWRMGYRYRLYYKSLPGKPDIVITKQKIVIFVHGCFWHRHENCIEASRPKTNSEYWETKINKNIERDKKHQEEIKQLGYKVFIIWECEVKEDTEKNIKLLEKLLRKKNDKLSL
jgi:DNA mismatch endonuclease (patch repair protein)